MAQFQVYKNKNARTKAHFPLLVDIQADLLDELDTRVVIPLTKTPALASKPISRLTPRVEVEGEPYVLMTPQLAGVPRTTLGTAFASVADQRTTIVSALDVLITGV